LNALVGNQTTNTGSNLFSGITGGQNLLDNSLQQRSMNSFMPTPQNIPNNLAHRMGKYTSLIDQQGPRIPAKRQRPNPSSGSNKDMNRQAEDITVILDDEDKANKNRPSNIEPNKRSGKESFPLEVGSKRGSNSNNSTANSKNGGTKLPLPSNIDPKKRTNVSKVRPAVKSNKENGKDNNGNKDDVMVVDDADDEMMEMLPCDVIINSGEDNVETIPEKKVDSILDEMLDCDKANNNTNTGSPGKEVDLMLNELIDNDLIKNNPELLEDIMAQVPYAKSRLNNKSRNCKVDSTPKKPTKEKATEEKPKKEPKSKQTPVKPKKETKPKPSPKPKAVEKAEKTKKDESQASTEEANLDDNLKEFESEESANLSVDPAVAEIDQELPLE
jgi:hypothetical protein